MSNHFGNWDSSGYLARKAERQAKVKPEWIINPTTGEQFYLRKVGGLMTSMLAGYMPAGATEIAVKAWKEQGVEGLDASNALQLASQLTPEQREAGQRETESVVRIVQGMCVIPLLSNDIPEEVELSEEWKADAARGLKEKDPKFDAEAFDFKRLVFDPEKLDEDDSIFLFQWAKGLGDVALKGGNVVTAGNFSGVSKKLNRGTRASADKSKVREAS